MLDRIRFEDTDTRVRRYLVPERILRTQGDVENATCLLTYRNRQIHLQEKSFCRISTEEQRGGILLDFGTELHGGALLSVHKVIGEGKVRLSFGESASEALSTLGQKGACNDHCARDFTVEVKPYSVNEYGTTGFRFLFIELLSPGSITLVQTQAVAIYQPLEYLGSFHSDDELLNRIYDTAAYTCHLCVQNELWDGIKRDRLIWVGDVAPELKAIKYLFGEIPQLGRTLSLSAEDAPLPLWINKHPTYSLWWLVNLEEWVHYTGNRSYLAQLSNYVCALVPQILENIDERGDFSAATVLDWPSKAYPDLSRGGIRTLLFWALNAGARLCRMLDKVTLAEACEGAARSMQGVKRSAGHLKQVAAMLMLGGFDDPSCAELLQQNGAKGLSTFMSYYILSAMTKCCSTEHTLQVLKDYYGGMLAMGATTFFEDFDLDWTKNACPIDEIPDGTRPDLHGDFGNYCYRGFRHSLCHGWSCGPVPFLTEHVLGVSITDEACRAIEITPHLGHLQHVRGSIATPHGKVEIEHERQADGSVHTTVHAPEGIRININR